MPILLTLILGAAAGWVTARLMALRTDPITVMALGFLGAMLGALGMRLVLSVLHWGGMLVAAVGGAVLAIWLWRLAVERR